MEDGGRYMLRLSFKYLIVMSVLCLQSERAFAQVPATDQPVASQVIYVSPQGNDAYDGSEKMPLYSLAKAIDLAQPGCVIYLRDGTYWYDSTVVIDKPGSAEKPFRIEAFAGEHPILNFSKITPADEAARGNSRGLFISTNAQWWTLKGLDICHAPDNGVKSEGGHIRFEQCVFHDNGDTGLQIGLAKGKIKSNPDPEHFAAYNVVVNCDAYRNADPATKYENADGFACKLNAGKGNQFIGCRAWENADDGWDFYLTKEEITLDHCWSWHNGDSKFWDTKGVFQGDGNGFKLGGDDTYCPITVRNCVALDCQFGTAAGFAYNNNTAPFVLYNCLTINCGKPYKLRQPGNTLKNCVDVKATKPAPRDVGEKSVQDSNNWNLGITATENDFISLSVADAGAPREKDGSLPKNGFARLKPGSALIDRGIDVGLPFSGKAPDLGPFELSE